MLAWTRVKKKTGDAAQPILAPAPGQPPAAVRKNFLERRVPFVTEDVAAFALAFLRSFMRAPEIRMALFSNVIIIVAIVPITMMTRMTGQTISPTVGSFYAAGAAAIVLAAMNANVSAGPRVPPEPG